MNISYKLASGGGYLTIADDAIVGGLVPPSQTGQAFIAEFNPQFKSATQPELLFRSASATRFNRGNTICTLPLQITISYGSNADAAASIRTYGGLKDTLLHLQVTVDTEIQYYPNALLETYTAKLEGASVVHAFVFMTDNVTNIAP